MPHIKDCEQIPVIDEQLAGILESESEPFSIRVADALDALVDGRGVGKEELAVIALCDAAPEFLKVLRRIAGGGLEGWQASSAASSVISKLTPNKPN